MIYPYVNCKSKIGCKLWVLGKMNKDLSLTISES